MRKADLLERLSGVRPAGGGHIARCPSHEDARQSLSVGDGDNGGIVLKCHAGCSVEAIVGALGLALSDLFADDAGTSTQRREVARYGYHDTDGRLRYEVVRFEPKDFRQRRPDGAGGWIWNLQDTPRLVYRLPELLGQSTVVVVEGEKDADRLWAAGIAATTNVGGAGKWRDAYTSQLREAGVRELVIVPDNDDPGRAHAAAVASAWAPGPARILTLPDVPAKGDVSDFLAARSVEAFRALLTPPVEVPPWLDVDAQWAAMADEDREASTGRRIWLGLTQIDSTIDGVRRGEVLGWFARPGIGKTIMLTHVTQGVGEVEHLGHVFFSLEMPAAQIVARLQQRIFRLGRQQREAASLAGELSLERYRQQLQNLIVIDTPGLSIAQMEGLLTRILSGPFSDTPLGLVTIDHLGLIGGDRRMATYDRVSVQAREIKELAKRFRCAVQLAVQVNRDAGGDGSRELGLGAARDSGVVEEAMDYMVGMRRLDRSLTLSTFDRDKYRDVIFAKVIKNRHGDTDTRETAYRFYPVGLRLEEDRQLQAEQNDIAKIAAMGGRR